jgi:EAL and modified HD-GYP domain-containing signal transduction protein
VDYIKLDIRAYEKKALIETVNLLKRYTPKLLAEKVETAEEFRYCNELGFKLFQGYFFARPTIIEGQRLSPSQTVLFELFNSLSKEEPVDIIERLFKREPELDFKLLRLINSAGYYRQTKIASIRQAIILLGYRQLQRWVSLMLFAGDIKEIGSNPILEKAAIRGIMLGLLTKKVRRDRDLIEAGFIAGILSMTDVLLHMPIDTIVSELNITEEIALALTERKGVLGRLLLAIEKVEDEDLEVAGGVLRECGLDLSDLMTAEADAIIEYSRTECEL